MYILDAYDSALEQILKTGTRKKNRTGTDTLAVFGIQSRYRIDECFPLVTRRKVWPKSIFAELLWFISGSTNNKDLQALGCNIWTPWVEDKWSTDKGFVQGALGPLYGFQLRHFGGYYGTGDMNHTNYGKRGFDQLAWMVNEIKTNPESRRIIFSLWNPAAIPEMKLPPCHFCLQIYIEGDKMSGMLTQRSCDFLVGVAANVQFYSTLIYMLAQQTGYKPYELIHSTADSHLYCDHLEAVEEYLSREKPDSPKLELKKADDIFSYKLDDFNLINYNPLEPIKVPVAV